MEPATCRPGGIIIPLLLTLVVSVNTAAVLQPPRGVQGTSRSGAHCSCLGSKGALPDSDLYMVKIKGEDTAGIELDKRGHFLEIMVVDLGRGRVITIEGDSQHFPVSVSTTQLQAPYDQHEPLIQLVDENLDGCPDELIEWYSGRPVRTSACEKIHWKVRMKSPCRHSILRSSGQEPLSNGNKRLPDQNKKNPQ